MADFKSLLKDTAVYGLSSIVGRFLNYLLVPLYTYKIAAESGGYGIITNLYAYTALLLVLLTYGMETAFFRFANKEGEDAKMVFSTALRSLLMSSVAFATLAAVFIKPLSEAMGYGDCPSYVLAMAVTVAIDAFQCILFAYLRYKGKAIKFAALKLTFIAASIFLNLCAFVFLPEFYGRNPQLWGHVYDPSVGVGYVFYINLFCTAAITLLFAGEIRGIGYGFDGALLRRMLSYSWPILLLGIAGILNQTIDKILFPGLYKGDDASVQLGIYGAASKIAMIMAMITQAFRYAYEPFVFGSSQEEDRAATYARGMKYFLIFTLLAYITVVGYMDLLKHIINSDYWTGLRVVPIVMAAEIMMGIYFNLSFWYKLTDKTLWGAIFSGAGCAVLIAVNVLLVPRYGYMACAWGGVAGYGTAMLLSYFVGQKYYPVDYPLRDMLMYVAAAAALCIAMTFTGRLPLAASLCINTLLIASYGVMIIKRDLPALPALIAKRIRRNG